MASKPTAQRGLLALALLSGPIAAGLAQQLSYGLVQQACRSGAVLSLVAIAALAALACLAAGILSWRLWQARDAMSGRSRLLSGIAMIFSMVFLLVSIALLMPNLFIGPCR